MVRSWEPEIKNPCPLHLREVTEAAWPDSENRRCPRNESHTAQSAVSGDEIMCHEHTSREGEDRLTFDCAVLGG
jgi:hypothetical protein